MENLAQQQRDACIAAYQDYWQQQGLLLNQMAAVANQQLANQAAQATQRLEPGITWERTRGNRHRVVIRREAEYVPVYGNGLAMAGNALPQLGISVLFGSWV